MDEFAIIGLPFAVFLVAAVLTGRSIGRAAGLGEAAGTPRATMRRRLAAAALVAVAAGLTALGAAAATAAGAFARLTDAGYAIEPAALLLVLEAAIDLVLAAVVAVPGWTPRRAWVMRTIGVYWLCLAIPTLVLADGGSGWISLNPGDGMTLLGVPSFGWEAVAVVVPALLLWRASLARVGPIEPPVPTDANPNMKVT
jgi:hypothetical protein